MKTECSTPAASPTRGLAGLIITFLYALLILKHLTLIRKKNQGRPYRSFFSSVSAYHAKEQAYNYIVQQIGAFSDNEH